MSGTLAFGGPLAVADPGRWGPWLVGPRFDLGVFLVPALVALALVPVGDGFGGELPIPMWVATVLVVDVAHVYATLFVTYLSPTERRRHRRALWLVPVAAGLVGWGLAAWSVALFWTVLAYLAVFHFVRQQVGWVALYQRKQADLSGLELRVERWTVYAATLFPVLWWHAHLPRSYQWFIDGDFRAPPGLEVLLPLGWILYVGLGLGFVGLQAARVARGRSWSVGKVVVVLTTAACWGVGIIATNSDWAFTVTNVLIHGVPYIAYVGVRAGRVSVGAFAGFAAVLVALAYGEELLWDRLVWHEMSAVFPVPEVVLEPWMVSLGLGVLAVPQVTHYVLDGLIWRRPNASSP